MPDEGPDRRFDYLFEPQVDTQADEDVVDGAAVATGGAHRKEAPGAQTNWILGIVVAAAIAGVVALGISFLRPDRTDPVDSQVTPGPPTTTAPSRTAPNVTAPPVQPAQVPAPEPAPLPAPVPSQSAATVAPQPPPPQTSQPEATQPPPQRETTQPPSPTTRAPISVEPEPRPPFPNQQPPEGGGDNSGGLL